MTADQFAVAVLKGIGATPNKQNMKAMRGWMAAEGGHYHNNAQFNPLNTTQPAPGAGNTGSQGNIKVYRSWDQGVAATIKTLKNGYYGGIISALKKGTASQVADAIAATPWGTTSDLIHRTIASAQAPAHIPDGPAAAATTHGVSRPAASITTPSLTVTPDSSGARVAAAMDLLHHKTDALGFAAAVKGGEEQAAAGATQLPGHTFKIGERTQHGVQKGDEVKHGPHAAIHGGGWGGSEGVVSAADEVARRFGAAVTSTKRSPEHNRQIGGSPTSDHLTTATGAYAKDYGISGAKGVELGNAIARKLGVTFAENSYASGGIIEVGGKKYKVQILFGSGIKHGDHVHVGAHLVG